MNSKNGSDDNKMNKSRSLSFEQRTECFTYWIFIYKFEINKSNKNIIFKIKLTCNNG